MDVSKEQFENLCRETNSILILSDTIEIKCSKIIELFTPLYTSIEKPVDKSWEIKKLVMGCIEQNGISWDSDEYMNYYEKIDEELTDLLLKETMRHEQYYKNILKEESFEMFEKIVTLLQGEVQFFYENLVYTQKIFDFIHGFREDGSYPTDLLFLRTFLGTASSNMILIACKLFYSGSVSHETGENVSLYYLRNYIFKNSKDKNMMQTKLKNIKPLMEIIKAELPPLEKLRNTYIAHYQVSKEEHENIKIDINSLKKIFDVVCELFEELSLMYFQGKDIGRYNFIRHQGFKKAVCQNLIMDNIQKLDIEAYFDYLRRNFYKNLPKITS